MTSRWDNPTGGLGYHVRAWRYRNRYWSTFLSSLSDWLEQWSPQQREILLIGPSGGHCMDFNFLAKFSSVVCVDTDPFASFLFRWRARGVFNQTGAKLVWDSTDYLSPGKDGFSMTGLDALLAAHPTAAVLFCNILGQLPLLGEDRASGQDDTKPAEGSYESWLLDLPNHLQGRSWASFHDRLSGPVKPENIDEKLLAPWSTSVDLIENYYPLQEIEDVTMLDHRTAPLLKDLPRRQMIWEIVPGTYHLIEAVSIVAATADRQLPA